jgi:hypothetical protein
MKFVPGQDPAPLPGVQAGSYLGEDDVVRLDNAYEQLGTADL